MFFTTFRAGVANLDVGRYPLGFDCDKLTVWTQFSTRSFSIPPAFILSSSPNRSARNNCMAGRDLRCMQRATRATSGGTPPSRWRSSSGRVRSLPVLISLSSDTQPQTCFLGGTFSYWSGPGYGECYQLINEQFANVLAFRGLVIHVKLTSVSQVYYKVNPGLMLCEIFVNLI